MYIKRELQHEEEEYPQCSPPESSKLLNHSKRGGVSMRQAERRKVLLSLVLHLWCVYHSNIPVKSAEFGVCSCGIF